MTFQSGPQAEVTNSATGQHSYRGPALTVQLRPGPALTGRSADTPPADRSEEGSAHGQQCNER